MNRYWIFVVPAFVVLLIIIGIIILFTGGGGQPTTNQEQRILPLPEYSDTNADVSMTIDGRINGDDTHSGIRITVDQYQRRLDILSGYNGNIVQTETLTNNQKAYSTFLYAIRDAGFMLPKKSVSPAAAQETGKCPLGFRYTFELNDGGEELSSLWSASCRNIGTLGVNSSLLQSLFKAQITDYNKLVNDVEL